MNKTIRTLAAVMGSVACFAAPSVQAAPQPTLSFLQPSGTVGPNDTIDVRLRLTAGDLGLHFDNANPGAFLGSANALNIPSEYHYTSISSLYATTSYACGAPFNFDDHCYGGSPYTIQFNYADGFVNLPTLDLNPGQSYDYLLGSFMPSAGPVPVGTYQLIETSAQLWLSGTEYGPLYDAAGFPIYDANGPVYGESSFTDRWFTLATTCANPSDTGCGFSRTVVGGTSVPEPGSMALMLAAFGGLVGVRRKAGQRLSTIEA